MEKFTFDLAFWGYHIYKVVWKPTIGEKLQADQELGNKADICRESGQKQQNSLAIYLASTRELCGILFFGRKICSDWP